MQNINFLTKSKLRFFFSTQLDFARKIIFEITLTTQAQWCLFKTKAIFENLSSDLGFRLITYNLVIQTFFYRFVLERSKANNDNNSNNNKDT